MQQTVFREQALERLSSPEQLDQVMQVTPLRGWLALLALAGLLAAALVWGVLGSIPIEVNAQGLLLSQQGIRRLVAPSDGVVTAHLRGGDAVHKGDAVVRLRDANGQEVDVASEQDGIVVETYVHTGYPVQAGSPVANIEPSTGGLEAVLMVPATDAKNIQPGMPVHVSPANVSAEQFGVLLGQVVYVSPFPASPLRLQSLLEDESLVRFLAGKGPVHEVAVQLNTDPSTPSGYQWSSGGGPPMRLTVGTLASADIVLAEQRPLGLVLPVFN